MNMMLFRLKVLQKSFPGYFIWDQTIVNTHVYVIHLYIICILHGIHVHDVRIYMYIIMII